jgi:nucleotide-binding universal stress UspA family protein
MKTLDAATRISLKNILYATDFSPTAEAALPYVSAIATKYASKVFVVHVKAPDSYAMVPTDNWLVLAKSTEEEIKKEAASLHKRLGGIPHEILIGEGDTWSLISKVIQKQEIDLLVLGTHGRTGIEKFMLGSVAEMIFRQATCPVLTIGPHASEHGNRHVGLRKLLYATDFTPGSLAAAPFAFSFAQAHQADLTLLNVLEVPETASPQNEYARRLLKALVPEDAQLECTPKFVIRHGEAADKILEVAKEIRADLIMLGVRSAEGRIGIATHIARPTSHRVLIQAPCPVLTVRG